MEPNLSWSVKNGALIPPTRWMQIEAVPDLEWSANLRKMIERMFEPLTLRFIKKGEGLRWFQYGSMYMKPMLSLNKGTTPPPQHVTISGSQVTFRFITEHQFNDMDELTKLKLFVHGFSAHVSTRDLIDHFDKIVPGNVVHSQIAPATVNSRSYFGYVLFRDRQSLNLVLESNVEHKIKTEVIKIQEFDSKIRKGGGCKTLQALPRQRQRGERKMGKNSHHSHSRDQPMVLSESSLHKKSSVPIPYSSLSLDNEFDGALNSGTIFQRSGSIIERMAPTGRISSWSIRSNHFGESKSDSHLEQFKHLYYKEQNCRRSSADFPQSDSKPIQPDDLHFEILKVPTKLITVKNKNKLGIREDPNLVFNLLAPNCKLQPLRKP
jgi:hypothetical protein